MFGNIYMPFNVISMVMDGCLLSLDNIIIFYLPGNIVEPPDKTTLFRRSFLMSMSDFITDLYRSSWIPLLSMPKGTRTFIYSKKLVTYLFKPNSDTCSYIKSKYMPTCFPLHSVSVTYIGQGPGARGQGILILPKLVALIKKI